MVEDGMTLRGYIDQWKQNSEYKICNRRQQTVDIENR